MFWPLFSYLVWKTSYKIYYYLFSCEILNVIWHDKLTALVQRGKCQKHKYFHMKKMNVKRTGLWRRLEIRFLCCGPESGVECWGDWRPSGTPSLGLRCTGVPLGVGDLLIFCLCDNQMLVKKTVKLKKKLISQMLYEVSQFQVP